MESRKDCITSTGKDRKVVRQQHEKFWDESLQTDSHTQIIQSLSHAHTHFYTLSGLYGTWVAWQRWQGVYQLKPGESKGTRARKRQDERKRKGERVSRGKWETLCDRQRGCVWKRERGWSYPPLLSRARFPSCTLLINETLTAESGDTFGVNTVWNVLISKSYTEVSSKTVCGMVNDWKCWQYILSKM